MACKIDYFQAYLHISFGVLWGVYTLWWVYNTWVLNSLNRRSIQKLIFFVLLFKALHTTFYGCSRVFCSSSEDEAYWGLAITSTFTLFNTFLYTVMALMSKGFCLNRENLDRGEVTSVAIVMGLVYLGFSAYLIEPVSVAPVLLVILGLLFFNSVKSSIKNYKLLQIRYVNLQQANILVLLPGLRFKISTMKWFLFLSYLFYVSEIVKVALQCIGNTLKYESNNEYWVYSSSFGVVFSSVTCFGIFWIYRTKARPLEFNASVLINEIPVAIAPIYSVVLPESNVQIDPEKPAVSYYVYSEGNVYVEVSEVMMAVPIK